MVAHVGPPLHDRAQNERSVTTTLHVAIFIHSHLTRACLCAVRPQNNLLRHNQGGLGVTAGSSGLATSLRADVSYNVFSDTSDLPALLVAARPGSPYQTAVVYNNYVTRSHCRYTDVIQFNQVPRPLTDAANTQLFLSRYSLYSFPKVYNTNFDTGVRNTPHLVMSPSPRHLFLHFLPMHGVD